jgi:hypothetical protein
VGVAGTFRILLSKSDNLYLASEKLFYDQNYWVFGLFPSSDILGTRKHVSETGSVCVLRCGGKTPTQLGPLVQSVIEVSSV